MANQVTEYPVFYIFSGLPGTGKTTISKILAQRINAAYLRIDTIEQALRDVCRVDVEGEGYCVAYRIVVDNLRLGMSVVADSCNPIESTRREWEGVARDADVPYFNIEIICSDRDEHRRRIEARNTDVPGLALPTWLQVQNREYHPWKKNRIIIDTAGRTEEECAHELLSQVVFPT